MKNKIYSKIISRILASFMFIVFVYADISVSSVIFDLTQKSKIVEKIYNLEDRTLCNVFSCNSVIKNNQEFYYKDGLIIHQNQNNHNFIHLYNNFDFDLTNFQLGYRIDDRIAIINLSKYVDRLIFIIGYSLPMLVLLLVFVTRKIIIEEETEGLIRLASTEALSTNQGMINIAENINHELNTPIEVINSKIFKIKSKIEKEGLSYEKDFNYIYDALDQINSVLDRMRKFKTIKYSNGNKTIYDILETSVSIIHLKNSMFEYHIDDEFKKYILDHKYIQNADLMNILLNHIKNSLEANATKISVDFGYYNQKLNRLVMFIKDNGNGIPIEKQKHIFKPNYSTKQEKDDVIRGNGMFLNKTLIEYSDGRVSIEHSNPHGTIIRLSFHAFTT